MNDLSVQNPLMLPISYNGGQYYTSQYFHAQYRENAGEKYQLLKNFNALIRSIESYQDYIDRGDIVELSWNQAKITGLDFKPVYESISYKPIMLINSTAQIALTHHLDDEISKRMSVAINTKFAEDIKQIALDKVADDLDAAYKIALFFGLEGNQAKLKADKVVKQRHGVSPMAMLEIDLVSPIQVRLLTPTEIGQELGGVSAQSVNKLLAAHELQSKATGKWVATEKGKSYAKLLDVNKESGGAPVQQLKWYESVIELIK
jgi:hypothetical protein